VENKKSSTVTALINDLIYEQRAKGLEANKIVLDKYSAIAFDHEQKTIQPKYTDTLHYRYYLGLEVVVLDVDKEVILVG